MRFEGVREGLDVVATDDAVFVACQCNSGPSLLAYDPATGAKRSTDGYAGYVQHLAVGGGRLYVAGGVGGHAAFDLATRTRVPWTAPVIGSQPRALAVGADGTVALGGSNGAVNGALRNDLAAFDLRTGALLPFDPRPDTPNALPPKFPQVQALAKVGDTLYVGGEFTQIAGVARKNLAALDVRTGAALDFPAARGRVFDLAVAGNRLFAGGELLEAYDLGTRTKLAWELGPEYIIRTLATVDDTLFIGGSFLWLDEGSLRHQRKYLAAFRTSDFAPVPVAEPNGWVYDLLADGAGGVWVGGGFNRLAGVLSDSYGRLDASGVPETGLPAVGEYSTVVGMASDGATLYLLGVDALGGQPRRGSAALRLSDRSVTAFNPGFGAETVLTRPGGEVLFGGAFGWTPNNSAGGVARFPGTGSPPTPTPTPPRHRRPRRHRRPHRDTDAHATRRPPHRDAHGHPPPRPRRPSPRHRLPPRRPPRPRRPPGRRPPPRPRRRPPARPRPPRRRPPPRRSRTAGRSGAPRSADSVRRRSPPRARRPPRRRRERRCRSGPSWIGRRGRAACSCGSVRRRVGGSRCNSSRAARSSVARRSRSGPASSEQVRLKLTRAATRVVARVGATTSRAVRVPRV